MAFNPAPSNWISGYSSDGTNITIPIASLPGLTAGEADAATGDIRKVMFGIEEMFKTKWKATLAADRPGKYLLSTASSVNDETGIMTKEYSHRIQVAPSGIDVVPEA